MPIFTLLQIRTDVHTIPLYENTILKLFLPPYVIKTVFPLPYIFAWSFVLGPGPLMRS